VTCARVLLLVCVLATTARAEAWYRGEHGRNRMLHLSLTTAGAALYPALHFVEVDRECRWCSGPNALDRSLREAVVWSADRMHTASQLSDLGGFVLAPGLGIGVVIAGTLRENRSWAGLIDDVVPIVETMVVTQWVTRAMKIGFARRRPYAHFGTAASDDDDNLSFPSGHASRAFAFATSAGMIARARGYPTEPYVWATGLTIAALTSYFRMAADKHYFTDVLVGGAVGVAAGLTVPLLMRRSDAGVEAMPTRTGIAFGGVW
jgi:membrane-associated phospholipid phosphatase